MGRLQALQIDPTATLLNWKFGERSTSRCFQGYCFVSLIQDIVVVTSLTNRISFRTSREDETNSLVSNNNEPVDKSGSFAKFPIQQRCGRIDLEGLEATHRENLRGSSEGTLAIHHTKFTAQSDEN